MDAEQLQQWLLGHAADIFDFTDLEISYCAEDALHQNLELYWFRDPEWNQPGYRFLSLGRDGTGGEVAIWLAPSRPDAAPVVFFGSEGGAGVLTESPLAFAMALTYAPLILEYEKGNLDAPSRLSTEDNWFLSGDDLEQRGRASEALARYRRSSDGRLGRVPAFENLISVPPTMQSEFLDWVRSIQKGVAKRDSQAREVAAQLKRQAKRDSASRYAALGADGLPSDTRSLADGYQFVGICAFCADSTLLRLTRFEEFVFAICLPCYFSKAW